MRQQLCGRRRSKRTVNEGYRNSTADVIAYLKRNGFSDETARWIAHETLVCVFREHGRRVSPTGLGDDLYLIAKKVLAGAAGCARTGEQAVPPTSPILDSPIESPENEIVAKVDGERARQILARAGRWIGCLVAFPGGAAMFVKRIVGKGYVAAGAGSAVAAVAVASLVVPGLLPDNDEEHATIDGQNRTPIVQSIRTATTSSQDGRRDGAPVSHRSIPTSTEPAQGALPPASRLELAADTGPGRKQSSEVEIATPVGPIRVASGSDADGPATASSACERLPAGCPSLQVNAEDAPTTDGTPTP